MKRSFTTFSILSLALIALTSCGSREHKNDTIYVIDSTAGIVADSTVQDSLVAKPEPKAMTEADAKALIKKLWKGLPDHGMNSKTKASLTPDFYNVCKKGFAANEKIQEQGDLGDDFMYYWYTGQDADSSDGITKITITSLTPEKVKATVIYNTLGSAESHRITLMNLGDNDWRISDFDNMRPQLKEYIKHPS